MGGRPRKLWQLRYAAGVKRSRVDRHQGRRVGRQKLPSPERGQNDNDRSKTREFKQRDGKASGWEKRKANEINKGYRDVRSLSYRMVMSFQFCS